jgi:thioredoxin 1
MIAYITELNTTKYNDFIKEGIVLVDVWAPWCGPCKQISPIVDQISNDFQGKVTVGKLNADDARDILSELGVRNIPTILLYKNGEIVERSVGMTTKEKLTELIETHLN